MDYEKKYKEALGWMQSLYNGLHGATKEDAEHYFPELAESEDERVRKELLNAFQESEGSLYMVLTPHRRESFIAWLEKQGTSYTKKDVDNAYLKGVTDTKNEIEKQYEATYQIRKDIATFIFNYRGDIKDRSKWIDYLGIKVSFVEMQGEQKETLCDKCKKEQPSHSCQDITALGRCAVEHEQNPADKVEPKFKVGEWITIKE